MAFQFRERARMRNSTSNPPTRTLEYVATGEVSDLAVKAYSHAATPQMIATLDGILYRQDVRIEQVGYDTYYVSVPYGPRKTIEGEYRLSFDTTGGTVHLSHSRETVASYGTSPPSFGQLIDVNGDEVRGADVVIPALKLNVLFRHPQGVVTLAKIKFLASITGTVNSQPFLTFAPGEVLFLGCSGMDGTDTAAEVQYQFACASNETDLTIGGVANVARKGHEKLWIRYQDVKDGDYLVKQPKWVYRERLYEEIDLAAALGFG